VTEALSVADTAPLYPPPPADVPHDLTRRSGKYRREVIVLTVSLLLFVLLYLALLAASAWFTYWAFTHHFGTTTRRGTASSNPLLNIGLGLAGAMLFLFLLKGLFKGQRADRSHYVEVTERDQPELFGFIHCLCEEVSAPHPARVYLSPDVNAAVVYDSSLVNLIVPPKKHLLIGLGLVNSVTLSEFKATLAHEFGHFSQCSLGLGTYVYVANRVLHDVVYARDTWDQWLHWWCRWDIRVSFPAWGLRGVVWGLRHGLGGAFRGINLMDRALSRQMEFNADDVAVSAAGSDSITHVLCRLEFAGESLSAAAQDLFAAADHGLFTRDLFYHQTTAAERLRRQRKDPRLGLPPAPASSSNGEPARVFDPSKGDDGIPAMWRTHPPNHEREANAKRHYLRVQLDDRSPWLLFRDLEQLKEDVSRRFYKHSLDRKETCRPTDPVEVQKFIDAEHAATTYDPKYYGLYDDRFVGPGDGAALAAEADRNPWPAERLGEFLRGWPGADLEERMEKNRRLRGEYGLLQGLKNGELTLKGKTFSFREEERTMRDVPRLFEAVDKEISSHGAALDALDRDVFSAHYQAARLLDSRTDPPGNTAPELLERYRFHLAAQDLLRRLNADEARVMSILNYLQGKTELEPAAFKEIVQALREVADSLEECVSAAEKLHTPMLTNVPAGTPLRQLIWEKGADIPRMQGDASTIQSQWIVDYLRKQGTAQGRVRRVHFKSLGGILALQERVAAAYRGDAGAAPPIVDGPITALEVVEDAKPEP
jgi:Zn-dependent protease with chaperone function